MVLWNSVPYAMENGMYCTQLCQKKKEFRLLCMLVTTKVTVSQSLLNKHPFVEIYDKLLSLLLQVSQLSTKCV